jgi:hypothetical protein
MSTPAANLGVLLFFSEDYSEAIPQPRALTKLRLASGR